MYITCNDGYQNFIVFAPMFSSLTADNSIATHWLSSRISSGNIKAFNTKLEPIMCKLASNRVILKFNNSVQVQKNSLI